MTDAKANIALIKYGAQSWKPSEKGKNEKEIIIKRSNEKKRRNETGGSGQKKNEKITERIFANFRVGGKLSDKRRRRRREASPPTLQSGIKTVLYRYLCTYRKQPKPWRNQRLANGLKTE